MRISYREALKTRRELSVKELLAIISAVNGPWPVLAVLAYWLLRLFNQLVLKARGRERRFIICMIAFYILLLTILIGMVILWQAAP